MPRRLRPNPNRKIRSQSEPETLRELANKVHYGGNPVHKRNPGDFGLAPPSRPMPDKTLCDPSGVFTRKVALKLLREGIERGCISEQEDNGFPRMVWSVDENEYVFEAKLDNRDQGSYHGYPLPQDDVFREAVLEFWKGEK